MRSVLRQPAPFVAVLAVLYAGGYLAGTIIDADSGAGGHEEQAAHGGELRLALDRTRFAAGERQKPGFGIEDPDGTAGEGDDVRFTARRNGRVLGDVKPYPGARGHLVAPREGDLSFLHMRPNDDATAGRDVRFGVEYPSNGRYRLSLQFTHDGRVHTAAFTQELGRHGHDG